MPNITYAQAINDGIREEMRRDPKIVILGEDVAEYGGLFGVTRGLYDEFGAARVRDCPMSEASIVGFGIGLAIAGRPAIAELEFMDFMTLAMDALANQAAKLRHSSGGQVEIPLVVRMPVASNHGFGSQHSQSLEAWIMHVPGLRLAMPSTPLDAKGLIKSAIRERNPVVFVENVDLYASRGEVPDEEYLVPFGSAEIRCSGDDVTVVALSAMVPKALQAAEALAKDGISVEVIDPRTLAPLDIETIVKSVKKTGHMVVTHSAPKTAGVGAEIAQQVVEHAFNYLDGPIVRVAAKDVPIATNQVLETATLPEWQEIVDACISCK